MKKKVIITCILVVVIICIVLLIKVINSDKSQSYYTVTYLATDNTYDILNNSDNYVIVSDESELNNILNKVDANKFKQFNEDFLINNKLLIVQAGINPEMHKLKIRKTKIDVTIYFATPLMSADQENEYNLYIIPISKDINNYNVERMPYPNREY